LEKLELQARKTKDLKLPAQRPLYSVLSNRKLADFLGWEGLGSWKTYLRKFLETR
jgi:dTDP-4-dehydrorhamnose reductase